MEEVVIVRLGLVTSKSAVEETCIWAYNFKFSSFSFTKSIA